MTSLTFLIITNWHLQFGSIPDLVLYIPIGIQSNIDVIHVTNVMHNADLFLRSFCSLSEKL